MANYKQLGTKFDRTFRNDLNENFATLDVVAEKAKVDSTKAIADSASAITTANTAKTKSDSTQAQLDQVVIAGDSSVEAAQARVKADGTAYTTLKDRLNDSDVLLSDIAYNINQFPRQMSETDDCDRVLRAIAAIPEGAVLYFPNGSYNFASRTLPITKTIVIKGQSRPKYDSTNKILTGGAIFLNTIVRFQSDNIQIVNIGVQTTMSDGFQANSVSVKGLRLKNCISKATGHGFLFESYNGLVDDVICEDCEARDSSHGFIGKANRVRYINCKAYDCTTNGFGWISDNIPGVANPAINTDGLGQNCYAENCQSGFIMYCRDYFSTNNANNITMSLLELVNCTSKNCDFGITVGDPNTPPAGQTYNEVTDISIVNFREIVGTDSVFSLRLLLSRRVNIISPMIEKAVSYDRALAKDVNFENPISKTGSLGNIEDVQILTVNSATPELNYLGINNIYKTANTVSTVIAGFSKSRKRGTILILIDDDFTSILSSASINLKRNRYEGKGSWVVLKYDNTKWNELYGYSTNKKVIVRSLDSGVGALEVDRSSIWEVQFSADTTKMLSLTGNVVDNQIITIFIRKTTTGTGSYGGFDPATVISGTHVKTSLAYGTGQTLQLLYLSTISKWVIVSALDTPYL